MLSNTFQQTAFSNIFSYFSQKKGIDISCKLPQETICRNSQSLLSGKRIRKSINLLSAELAKREVKVKSSEILLQASAIRI